MIIVRLRGGLGNQMFQYAAGRRLSLIHNAALRLDLSLLYGKCPGLTPRDFALKPFGVRCKRIGLGRIARLLGGGRIWERALRRYACIREEHFHFDPKILDLPDNVCLDGYWQSERYFVDVAETIRSEFTVTAPLGGLNQEIAAVIKSNNSVSVHVRRGDFVSVPSCENVHGSCTPDYYRAAAKMLAERIPAPHFFIFSDEPSWARENLALEGPTTVVDHNGPDRPHEDMRLMSLCRNHIIANSTFSWWGAWLSDCPPGRVIAPARWFHDQARQIRDLYPAGWLTI